MNKRAREFIVKLFSLIIAITMSIPTNVFASSGTKRPKEMPTIIRLADSGGGEDTYIEDSTEDTYIEDVGEVYTEDIEQTQPAETTEVIEEAPQEEASTIAEEDASNYILSQKARLNDNHDGIIYDIKLAKKEKSYHDPNNKLSLSLMLNPNQALKDIKLTKVAIDGKEEKREDKSNKIDELHTLNLTTPTFENEITYTVEASIDKKAIDTNKLYSMDLSLDIGQFNLVLQRISYKFVEYEKEDKTKELKLTHIKEAEDALRSISYKKDDKDVDKVIYTDYIISKDKGDEESRANEKNKINYTINLENLKNEDTEISLDYYKADDKGFNIKKEFSANLSYQEKLDLDIPASYILKLTVTSKTDKKNTKIESHKINGREVKSPRFVKEEENSSDDDEEAAKKAEEEKKAAEEKAKAEERRKAEEAKKAEAERQDEDAKKAEEEAKSAAEKKEAEEKAKREQEAKEAKEKETSDKLKAEKEDLLKALKEKSPTKAEESKAKIEVKEDSNLSKADAELKAALKDKTKGIEDIQNLLTRLGEKYKLTREDQAKLMTANDAAIKALVEKDRQENFRPNVLADVTQKSSDSWDGKEFQLKTTMHAKASQALTIPRNYYFDIKVGKYLKLKDGERIKPLVVDGNIIATGYYYENGDDHYIRYWYEKTLTSDVDLPIDQNLVFDTKNTKDAESVDVVIQARPKNNPVQTMKTITVKKDDDSPVSTEVVIDSGTSKPTTYPYQLSWRTTSTALKDKGGNPLTSQSAADLNGAYVEWDIEIDTAPLLDANNEPDLEFNNLNLTVFAPRNEGLKKFSFQYSTSPITSSDSAPQKSSDNLGEIMTEDIKIRKADLGDKLYVKVKGMIDPSNPHETYTIGLRANPDSNYVEKIVAEFIQKYKSIPSIFKWAQGLDEAKKLAQIPFNLVETMIPARVGLVSYTTNERFYYDSSRTIVADRTSDTRAQWYALDLLRHGETVDPALDNPSFSLNTGTTQNIEPTKFYYIPKKDGGYRRTSQIRDVLLPNGEFIPGTLVSYEYRNQEGTRDDAYQFGANLKQKQDTDFNLEGTGSTEGGQVDLYTQKVSQQELETGYLAYIEKPYSIMRINQNFDMVQCFNSGVPDPTYNGKNKKITLDKNENPTGDFLISRLNESIGRAPANGHRLVNYLSGQSFDGMNLRNGHSSNGEAMEDLIKRIYFYGEEVKDEYEGKFQAGPTGKTMHRHIENSMYQRVLHRFTDGTDLSVDFFKNESDRNDDSWQVPYTLTGRKTAKGAWKDNFLGNDKDRMMRDRPDSDYLRKLRDDEERITYTPSVKQIQHEMAKRLYAKIQASYQNKGEWTKEKANTVDLVFYSHNIRSGKYQELITGRVTKPIEIDKLDQDGEKLGNAKFKITNVYDRNSIEWTSNTNTKSSKLYLEPGTYRVEEISTPPEGGYKKIEPFNIRVDRVEMNPDEGLYKFYDLPKIHVNDGFKTQVSLVGSIPKDPQGNDLVTIKDGQIGLEIKNIKDDLGKLEFVKRNNSTRLFGAGFTLKKLNADSLEDAKDQLASNKFKFDTKGYKQVENLGVNGLFTFEQIPAGYYILEETKVPDGYTKAPLYLVEAKEVPVGKETKVITSFVDQNLKRETVKRNGEEAKLPIIQNKAKETKISFRKVRQDVLNKKDEEHIGLQDAKFRLMSLSTIDQIFYLQESYSSPTKRNNNKRVDGQNAEGGGYITFDKIKPGTYLLEELQAPKGYEKTKLHGWKLVVDKDLSHKLYEVPKEDDINKEDLKEVTFDTIINAGDNIEGDDKKAYQIGNAPRKIDYTFGKYLAKDADQEPELAKELLKDSGGGALTFNLYKADYYGAKLKDQDGNYIKVNKHPIVQNIAKSGSNNPRKFDGSEYDYLFELHDLEFGGYYILEEENPPKGYNKAKSILLQVVAEAETTEGEMKVKVRDINNNTKFDPHGFFAGVINYNEKTKLGKFSIKKTGDALDPYEGKVGLRRAYFRLYETDDNFNKYKNAAGFYERYTQEVTPGIPLTKNKVDENGNIVRDKNGRPIQVPVDPKDLPKDQGIITFDNLKPGKYILEEYRGPAGYEKDPNPWYIVVDNDGTVTKYRTKEDANNKVISDYSVSSVRARLAGLDFDKPAHMSLMSAPSTLEISDVNIPQSVKASGWQDVDPARSDAEKVYNNQTNGRVESRILAINKDDGSKVYKQQILVTPNKKAKQIIDLARVNGTSTDDVTILSVKEVGQGSTLDKIVGTPTDIKYKRGRIQEDSFNVYKPRITTVTTTDKPILIEVEVPYSTGERIGLRVEYFLDGIGVGKRPSPYEKGYDNEDAINKENQTYKVNIDPAIAYGSVTADKTDKLKEGDKVTLTVTPEQGYRLKRLYYTVSGDSTEHTITGASFNMPASDVTIHAEFERIPAEATYMVNIGNFANGNVTASPNQNIKAGSQVTLSVSPSDGYKLASLVVSSNNGNESLTKVDDTTYTFTMPASDVSVSANFDKITTPDPGTKHEGNMKVEVTFTYLNEFEGRDNSDSVIAAERAGDITLQVNEGGIWNEVQTFQAPKKGFVKFEGLDANKNYRLYYKKDDSIAKEWQTLDIMYIPINTDNIDPKDPTVRVRIANGNLTEIFNRNETGFRIPLRITKVNENKAALSGAQFEARKIVNGDKKLYKDKEGGKIGEVEYVRDADDKPVYSDEVFDAVSEATGEPGDNYFRELTPGIYELKEKRTPDGTYRMPLGEDGKPMKWYFKVFVYADKKPSDADYMGIDFFFTHEFDENDAYTKPEYKDEFKGKHIEGLGNDNIAFNKYAKIIEDDGRSKPARPDAPYKGIHDVQVTNFKNRTELNFKKKDGNNRQNLEGAIFTLKRVKTREVDQDGKKEIVTESNGYPVIEGIPDKDENGKVLTPEQKEALKILPRSEDGTHAEAKSKGNLGVTFTNISEGTYILEETKPAKGYEKLDGFLTITFTEDEKGAWTQEIRAYKKEGDKYIEVTGYTDQRQIFEALSKYDANPNNYTKLEAIFNKKQYIDFKFKKVEDVYDDKENKFVEVPLPNSTFRVTQVDKDRKTLANGYQSAQRRFVGSNFNFENLGEGHYKLEETRVISDYEKQDAWYFDVVQDPDTYKLKIVFKDKDAAIRFTPDSSDKDGKTPKLDDKEGIRVANYRKNNFRFRKQDQDGNGIENVGFVLKKVKSISDPAKLYEYDDKGRLIKLTDGDKVTTFTYIGDSDQPSKINGEDVSDTNTFDSVSGATKKYYEFQRSRYDRTNGEPYTGDVNFKNLDSGLYELVETHKPQGFDHENTQDRWIIKVERTQNGLEVSHDQDVEKDYFANHANQPTTDEKGNVVEPYYTTYSRDTYNKTLLQVAKGDNKANGFAYTLTNRKTTTNLKWKKITDDQTDRVIESNAIFVLMKIFDKPGKDEMDKVTSGKAESKEPIQRVESDDGSFEVNNLKTGIYTLYEDKAPDGYKRMDRQIIIKVYEENGQVKKDFYELAEVNGKNTLITDKSKFKYLKTRSNGAFQPWVPVEDKDGNLFINNEPRQYFLLTKGYMENGKIFKPIEKGKLELKLYPESEFDRKLNPKVFTKTIDLDKDNDTTSEKAYRFDVPGVSTNTDYILEEIVAPDGFTKTTNKYRLQFVEVNNQFIPKLLAVLYEENGKLKEIKGENGRYKTETGYEFNSSEGIVIQGEKSGESTLKIVNKQTEITFTKVNQLGKKLSGVSFYLKKDAPDDATFYPAKKDMTQIKDGTDNGVYEVKSDENGNFTFKGLIEGTYEVWERQAPQGYITPDKAVKTFRVENGRVSKIYDENLNEDTTSDNKKIVNRSDKPGKLVIEKVDFNNPNKKLDGAVFRIEKRNPESHKFEKIDQNGNFLANQSDTSQDGWTATSDTFGKLTFYKLADGTYLIREIKAPDGYKIENPIVYNFTVKGGVIFRTEIGEDGSETNVKEENNPVQIKNKPEGNIYFKKTKEDNTTALPKAKFIIEKYVLNELKQGQFLTLDKDKSPIKDVDVGKKVEWEVTSDGNGHFSFEGLEDGIYKVREVEAPDGYRIGFPEKFVFAIKNGQAYEIDTDKAITSKTLDEATTKIDNTKDNRQIIVNEENRIYFEKVDGLTGKKLENAVFELWWSEREIKPGSNNQEIIKEAKQYKDDKGNVVTVKSDKDGKFHIKGLTKPGTYFLKETKAPSTYNLPEQYVYTFKVDEKGIYKKATSTLKADIINGKIKVTMVYNHENLNLLYKAGQKNSILDIGTENLKDITNLKVIRKSKDGTSKDVTSKFTNNFTSVYSENLYEVMKDNDESEDLRSTDSLEITFEASTVQPGIATSVNTGLILKGQAYGGGDFIEERKLGIDTVSGSDSGSFELINQDQNPEGKPIQIANNRKTEYPYTGGPGMWIGFTILGVLTMTAAGIYLAQKKKYQTK